jgi:hypothetical protein
MIRGWMRNEIIKLDFGHNRIYGSVHYSSTGLVTFIIIHVDNDVMYPIDNESLSTFTFNQDGENS